MDILFSEYTQDFNKSSAPVIAVVSDVNKTSIYLLYTNQLHTSTLLIKYCIVGY